MVYNACVIELLKYSYGNKIPFDLYFHGLKDLRAKAKIQKRLLRLIHGHEGDWKSVGEGVRELRFTEGKGHRVYYAWVGNQIIILLCGGDKSSQQKDIEKAKHYWRQYNE